MRKNTAEGLQKRVTGSAWRATSHEDVSWVYVRTRGSSRETTTGRVARPWERAWGTAVVPTTFCDGPGDGADRMASSVPGWHPPTAGRASRTCLPCFFPITCDVRGHTRVGVRVPGILPSWWSTAIDDLGMPTVHGDSTPSPRVRGDPRLRCEP
jgi:hypothetical protein